MMNSMKGLADTFRKLSDKDPLIFLDYDGTLVGIRMNPEDAIPGEGLLDELEALNRLYETYIVTGRSMKDIEGFIGYDLNIIALHGALARIGGIYYENVENFSYFEEKCDALFDRRDGFISDFPGLRMYNKHGNLLFHLGLMEQEESKARLIEEVEKIAEEFGMEVYRGKMIVELRIPGMNKGMAIRKIRTGRPSMIAGDDRTDEEAFSLNPDALRIKVGKGDTLADFVVENTEKMREFIRWMISLRS